MTKVDTAIPVKWGRSDLTENGFLYGRTVGTKEKTRS